MSVLKKKLIIQVGGSKMMNDNERHFFDFLRWLEKQKDEDFIIEMITFYFQYSNELKKKAIQ